MADYTGYERAFKRAGIKYSLEPGYMNRGHGDMIDFRFVVCLAGDSLILTKDGYKEIKDIKIGEEVWTHKNRWRKVTATQKFEGDLHKVRAWGAQLYMTPDHKMMNANGDFLPIKESSTLVHKIIDMPESDSPKLSDGREVTLPMAWVIGAWLADGTVISERKHPGRESVKNYMRIRINPRSSKSDQVRDYLNEAEIKFYDSKEKDGTATLDIGDRVFSEFVVQQFGQGSVGKKIPGWMFGNPKAAESLIAGYCFGDGYHKQATGTSRSKITVNTVSKNLAHSVVLLARQLGMYSRISLIKPPSDGEIKGKSFTRKTTYTFDIYETPPVKKVRSIDRVGDQWNVDINSVEYSHRDFVYDLTVDEDHSFIVEGLVSSNCHHTAGSPNDAGQIRVVRDGVTYAGGGGLKGPLSQIVLKRNGEPHVVAVGVCYHAPGEIWFKGVAPRSGNWHSIGIEAVSSGLPDGNGRYDWTKEQLDMYPKVIAALLFDAGLTPDSFIRHGDYQPNSKVDPAGLSYAWFLPRVKAFYEELKGGPVNAAKPDDSVDGTDVYKDKDELVFDTKLGKISVKALAKDYDKSWGTPFAKEVSFGDGNIAQSFSGGIVYKGKNSKAYLVKGDILSSFKKLGYTKATGLPLSNEVGLPDKSGVYQKFEKGYFYWSPKTKAHFVDNEFFEVFAEAGFEKEAGYPIEDRQETPLVDGFYQKFSNGSIYKGPDDPVFVPKGYMDYWSKFGWENGELGWPVELNDKLFLFEKGYIEINDEGVKIFANGREITD